MNVIVICGSILIILVVVVSSISIVKDYKDKLIEINKAKRRVDEDFDRLELRYAVESDAIRKINNDSISIINKLEEELTNKKEEAKLIKLLNENCNNIEVINTTKSKINKVNANIKTEIRNLIEEINKVFKNKIELTIDNNIPDKLYYDNIKLISALRLIISQTLKYNIDGNIKITLSKEDNMNSNVAISIKLENIKLIKNDNDRMLNIVKQQFLLTTPEPKIIETNIDSELLAIRQNLYYLSGKVEFKEANNIMMISFEFQEEKKSKSTLRALIVDDNKEMAKMNQKVLKELKIDSDIILNPLDCRKQLLENDYDIIFTDNQMPEMDGTELFRNLQTIDGFDIPVVIVTADNDMDDYFKTICGFDDYIVKPLTKERVNKTIKELMEKERIMK